jgi:hypothetical protein
MASRSILLDEEHFRAAEDRAKALGTTTDAFVSRLIDAEQALEALSFDQLLAPVRKGFERLSDDELDTLFAEAKSRATGSSGK